jgi:hypothetical protein
MKIKILRNTVCGGSVVLAGTVVDASEADAKTLIGMGKAEAVKAKAETADKKPGETADKKHQGGEDQ